MINVPRGEVGYKKRNETKRNDRRARGGGGGAEGSWAMYTQLIIDNGILRKYTINNRPTHSPSLATVE